MKIDIKHFGVVHIPDYYQQVDTLPEDPVDSQAFAVETESAQCLVMAYPISQDRAMPYDNVEKVIDGIHRSHSDDQGLVEVINGVTETGRRYIYSIVKTKCEPSGVQYFLLLHIESADGNAAVQGFFTEAGTTGARDAVIYELAIREGWVKVGDMSGWARDPYDPDYSRGFLMNISEEARYDEAFQVHPLSLARALVKSIVSDGIRT